MIRVELAKKLLANMASKSSRSILENQSLETAFEHRDFVEGSDFWVRFNNCKSLENLWPLRAKWRWLDPECKLREKVVEWRFPFDFEENVEKFFDAGRFRGDLIRFNKCKQLRWQLGRYGIDY